jgi:hypothetical protein
MNRLICFALIIAVCFVHAAEEINERPCDSREATVLSMMGWGLGLFAGIAALCALLHDNPDDTPTTASP